MGWEQRGNNSYYYRKERDGWRVKSTYVGRGEIAHMVPQIQPSSGQSRGSLARYVRECVTRRLQELGEELGYANSPPLERILIEQVIVCWVNLYVLEINSATKLRESHSTETGLYWDRRLTGAQQRFRRASESLARIRKLSRNTPALQFNIATSGGQKVNVTK
jgi:hypothetical protein